ncbi:TRAP transporter large permease [Halovivax limisalsi]|uniref:TRAP transporter large permease n=1 Tax=Halovivax limisalsi TaxID=1453760 RepID=UPI001FFCDFA4|nr:TRAP transporter large permease [Halovivax limisalsi]
MSLVLAAIMGVILVALIFSRMEVAFSIGLVGLLWLLLIEMPPTVLVSRAFNSIDQFILLAVPFFLLAGELMNRSGLTENLIRTANLTLGRARGGLAQANVGTSFLFAGITGAAVADVAALGSIFVPSMAKEGYDRDYSAALTAASSLIGPIIPPSIIIVIYGGMTETSVGGLFAAAIVPGILLGVAVMLVVYAQARRYDFPKHDPDVEWSEAPRILFHTFVALTMPAIILLGILFGYFTPTEAAAVASVYAICIGFLYRNLGVDGLHESMKLAVSRTGQLYIIVAFSGILSWLIAFEGIPDQLAAGIQGMGLGPVAFLLLTFAIMLFVGTWLETIAATIILAPTLSDIALSLGIHEYQFGMVFILSINIGLITPPVGICLFAAQSVSDVPVWDIAKRIVPFFVLISASIVTVILVPETTTVLPEYFGFN